MAPRLPSLDGVPIGFGHGGAMADGPDNAIGSFAQAIAMGASGIETKVWHTADGVAVLAHDGRIATKLRRRPIAKLNHNQLPDHVLTLTDLYEAFGTQLPLSIDVKDPAAFDSLLTAARRAGPTAEANLWICHPSVDQLVEWRAQTDAKLVNSARLSRLDGSPERRAAKLASGEIDAINLFHSDWTGGLISLFHRFGRLTLGWGAQHQREITELVDAGIDGIYSDHTDRMMAAIGEYY